MYRTFVLSDSLHFGSISKTLESANLNSFYICNVGKTGHLPHVFLINKYGKFELLWMQLLGKRSRDES